MRYAILGEEISDAESLKILVQRIISSKKKGKKPKHLSIKPKGYDGWSHLCRKGGRDLATLDRLGFDRFIVCVDADKCDPIERKRHVEKTVVTKSGIRKQCCVVIPIREIEAWILADLQAVARANVIPTWAIKPYTSDPERLADPKRYLRSESRCPKTKEVRYFEAVHNELVANHLDIELVAKRCKSFKSLVDFVLS